jgi:molecular chaperone GrpE
MAEDKKKKNDAEEIIEGEVIETGMDESQETVDAEANTAAMEEELMRLREADEKSREYFEGWQRERADFANFKRRVDRDQQMIAQNMKIEVIKKYITVVDDLERALKARPTEGQAAAWASGIDLILRKLQGILESEGLQRIPAETEEFNPARHEAITHEDSPDHTSGQIIEVVQQGYTLGDRVVRPALVRVAR